MDEGGLELYQQRNEEARAALEAGHRQLEMAAEEERKRDHLELMAGFGEFDVAEANDQMSSEYDPELYKNEADYDIVDFDELQREI